MLAVLTEGVRHLGPRHGQLLRGVAVAVDEDSLLVTQQRQPVVVHVNDVRVTGLARGKQLALLARQLQQGRRESVGRTRRIEMLPSDV